MIGWILVGFGVLIASPGVTLLLWPALQATNKVTVVLACTIPYLWIAFVAIGLGLLLALPRLWNLAGLGLIAVSLVTANASLLTLGEPPLPEVGGLRVLSLNTEFGRADQDAILKLAASADILAFQENTPELVESLENSGLNIDFPYRQGSAEYGANGTMIWSRTPLTLAATGQTVFTSLVVRTTVHDTVWTVSAIHAVSPLRGSLVWEHDGKALAELLRPFVGERLVVVGDFNAIDEHLTMRRIRDVGLVDSMSGWSVSSGDGFQNSWAILKMAPPLIRIDHALHSAAVEAWRPIYSKVSGTDHYALLAIFMSR